MTPITIGVIGIIVFLMLIFMGMNIGLGLEEVTHDHVQDVHQHHDQHADKADSGDGLALFTLALLYDTALSLVAIFRDDVAKTIQADWT